MSRRRWDERNYQTTWEDLRPWLDQLYTDHGVRVTVEVVLSGVPDGLRPVVRVVGRQRHSDPPDRVVFEDYSVFELRSMGQAERNALALISTALLTLDNAKWLEEQQSDLPF